MTNFVLELSLMPPMGVTSGEQSGDGNPLQIIFWHQTKGVGQCEHHMTKIIDLHDGYSTHPHHHIMAIFSNLVILNPQGHLPNIVFVAMWRKVAIEKNYLWCFTNSFMKTTNFFRSSK